MNIHIEYCIKWNYGPEFDRVSNIIKEINPNVIISSNQKAPRSGAFEITIHGKVVYSKFSTNKFPNRKILNQILNS